MKKEHALYLLWALTLLFCFFLVTDTFAMLRGDVPWMSRDTKWLWSYNQPRWGWVLPCVVGLLLYLAGTAYFLTRDRLDRSRSLILWTFGGAALLPLLLLTLEGEPLFLLFTRSASRGTGGYLFVLPMSHDMNQTLRHWPDAVKSFQQQNMLPGGVVISPPGLLVGYYGVKEFFALSPSLADLFGGTVRPLECQHLVMMNWSNAELASSLVQIFMPLWVALGVAPMYKLANLLYDRNRARLAVLLWPIVPGLAIFTPVFNVFYVLITVVMLLLLWRGLLLNRPRQVLGSGFIVSMGIFFNLAMFPLGLLGGLIILGHRLLPRPTSLRPVIRDLIAFGSGSLSVWLIYWLLTGQTPFTIIRASMKLHYHVNRPYFPWLFIHTYDTFLFVGLPLTILVFWRVARLRNINFRRGPVRSSDVMAAAMTLTLLIMVLSGQARGETGRVWLFFVPAWILMGADLLAERKRREQMSFITAQALCLLCMAGVLRVHATEMTMPPSPARASDSPTFAYNTQFKRGDDRVTLVGVTIEPSTTEVTLRLYWKADVWVERPYVLSLVSVSPDGTSRPALNWDPEGWDYPPTCWKPGHEFVDTVQIPVDQSGAWLFSLSISDVFTKESMLVKGADGQFTSQVGIGPVTVPAQ